MGWSKFGEFDGSPLVLDRLELEVRDLRPVDPEPRALECPHGGVGSLRGGVALNLALPCADGTCRGVEVDTRVPAPHGRNRQSTWRASMTRTGNPGMVGAARWMPGSSQ